MSWTRQGLAGGRLGSGSNVLADDGEHHYVVLSLKELKGEVTFDGELVQCQRRLFACRVCASTLPGRVLSGIEGWAEFRELLAALFG